MAMKERVIIEKYLSLHKVDGRLLVHRDTVPDIIVVIPCYDEPNISRTLNALRSAKINGLSIEVIVVVNSGEGAPDSVIEQNRLTYETLLKEVDECSGSVLISPVLLEGVRRKYAGVGYARKVGMDLAVWRFSRGDSSLGVIASLDADTMVESNYFEALSTAFRKHPKCYGAIINFAHPIDGDEYPPEVYAGIQHYELHLRYVNQALKMSSYPYVCHTVGSAFAVRFMAYVAHGGMNRRQGGEDFYFLHKLLPHGQFIELNSTTVHPSSRPSLRVPFGTGPQVNEFLESQELLTYNYAAFLELKAFVGQAPLLYEKDIELSEIMSAFLATVHFQDKLEEIRRNAATQASFLKRFYAFFDAFKVVKFLNFSHQEFFSKNNVLSEARRFLALQGYDVEEDAKVLLEIYRKVEGR